MGTILKCSGNSDMMAGGGFMDRASVKGLIMKYTYGGSGDVENNGRP